MDDRLDPPMVLCVGNPWDGMTLYGPFTSREALEEAEESRLCSGEDWWAMEVRPVPSE